jgi:uncharacterized protein with LGFP repeats
MSMLDVFRPTADTTFSERVVDSVARVVPGLSRRGFLMRSAVVGSAIAVNPFDFVFKPNSAYASVCGAGSSCGSGWTAFCCTVNKGANTCPPGSYAAGWWRVDDSAFCRGSARYIIDCNRSPGASCRCRCASGTCDQRYVCCNNFRYGQCNLQVKGVTEVVCRVVICTPPWKWDPACTTTVRVDNRTATHSAPCLPRRWPSHIEMKYQDLGMRGSVLGRPRSKERKAVRGGRKRRYANGYIFWHRDHGAREIYGPFATRYQRLKLARGDLGFPLTGRQKLYDDRGIRQRFERGAIFHSKASGTYAVFKKWFEVYRKHRGVRGPLGYPTSDPVKVTGGRVQSFESGQIVRHPKRGMHAVYGLIHVRYSRWGGQAGKLGFPRAGRRDIADTGIVRQAFAGGTIYVRNGKHGRVVLRPILRRYARRGGPTGHFGYPTSSTRNIPGDRGTWNAFEHGTIYAITGDRVRQVAGASHEVHLRLGRHGGRLGLPVDGARAVAGGARHRFAGGAIYRSKRTGAFGVFGGGQVAYEDEGGPGGRLGFPVADTRVRADGNEESRFEHGTIVHDPRTGSSTVS